MKNIIAAVFSPLFTFSAATAQHKHEIKIPDDVQKLLQQYACLACHKADTKVIGPAYLDVSKKKYTDKQIVELIYTPKPSNWPGFPPTDETSARKRCFKNCSVDQLPG